MACGISSSVVFRIITTGSKIKGLIKVFLQFADVHVSYNFRRAYNPRSLVIQRSRIYKLTASNRLVQVGHSLFGISVAFKNL